MKSRKTTKEMKFSNEFLHDYKGNGLKWFITKVMNLKETIELNEYI